MSRPITRKTLATRCGGEMNADRIRKNERTWGLDKCRANTGTRSVLYNEQEALRLMKERGLA